MKNSEKNFSTFCGSKIRSFCDFGKTFQIREVQSLFPIHSCLIKLSGRSLTKVDTLLLKIAEIRNIARTTNAVVIRISESKLNKSVLRSEIQIESYDVFHCDRSRHIKEALSVMSEIV